MPEVKRVHYFNQQFLTEKDFQDEQSYHIGMRRHHNRRLHTWGVAEGFEVEAQGPAHILVRPGYAVDRHGREIVLDSAEDRDVSAFGRNTRLFVSVQYSEKMSEEDRQLGAPNEESARVAELADLVIGKQEPADDMVPLAVINIDAGGRIEIDPSVRRTAGPYVPQGSIRTEHLADGCITPPKLSRQMELVSGWVRHCFKPHPVKDKAAYILGLTEAESGPTLAVGSMGIVSPPGAKRVLELTVAGRASGQGVTAILYRCGWNQAKSTHDRDELIRLEQKGEGQKGFQISGVIPDHNAEPGVRFNELDTRFNALAVSIESTLAHISLVAVRFEYQLDV